VGARIFIAHFTLVAGFSLELQIDKRLVSLAISTRIYDKFISHGQRGLAFMVVILLRVSVSRMHIVIIIISHILVISDIFMFLPLVPRFFLHSLLHRRFVLKGFSSQDFIILEFLFQTTT
jgi:hypothetical protein